jgi:acetate kinase
LKILVLNVGSTSFKFRLFRFDGPEEATLLARGAYERMADFGRAIDDCLAELKAAGYVRSPADLDGVGFKTVIGKHLTGCMTIDEGVIAALDELREIAPTHNPIYVAAIRIFRDKLPSVPLVALFETAFYQWLPEAATRYAVPAAWHRAGVRRFGFHGASHKFVAERSTQLLGRPDVAERVRHLYRAGPGSLGSGRPSLRVIFCHLGGSSSVNGLRDGVPMGTSMGMSPQSGLPHNNRVGDLDAAALPYVMKTLGLSLPEVERQMTEESGLYGLSGVSNDMRDIQAAAAAGHAQAQLALDVFVHSARQWGSGSARRVPRSGRPFAQETMGLASDSIPPTTPRFAGTRARFRPPVHP